MSQDELAKRMGYKDRSMITKIESGKVDISQKKILSFARVLNTTPSYLMGLDDQASALAARSNEEARLLEAYRHASSEIQRAALAMLENSASERRKTPASNESAI